MSEKIKRVIVPELEEILGHEFKVLDKGFVRVIDYLGGDSSIVQAARVSYGSGTKGTSKDEELIRYLMRHRHTTPFEMAEIKLHIKMPMDSWRQHIRHRTANVNEKSTRYTIVEDELYEVNPNEWRKQSESNRQGSSGFFSIEEGEEFSKQQKELHNLSRKIYEDRISKKMAREQARKDLPLAIYTEAYWKIDLHNLLHYLNLRMAPDAQWEIRQYANIIGYEIVSRWVPITWRAFLDYRLNSITLSAQDIKIIKQSGLLKNFNIESITDYTKELNLSKREIKEFLEKLDKLR